MFHRPPVIYVKNGFSTPLRILLMLFVIYYTYSTYVFYVSDLPYMRTGASYTKESDPITYYLYIFFRLSIIFTFSIYAVNIKDMKHKSAPPEN